MNLAARSFANSARMASFFSVENRRRRCFFGFAVLSTSNLCSANFLGTPGLSAGFQAKMTRLCLKKLVSGSSYLGFMLAPIIAVLDGSLVPRSLVLSFTSSGRHHERGRLLRLDFKLLWGELLGRHRYERFLAQLL